MIPTLLERHLPGPRELIWISVMLGYGLVIIGLAVWKAVERAATKHRQEETAHRRCGK